MFRYEGVGQRGVKGSRFIKNSRILLGKSSRAKAFPEDEASGRLTEVSFNLQYLASSQKTVTDFVERALKIVAPAEYASRATSHRLELAQGLGLLDSEQIAVFVCTTAFPCVACPLFVYEPRYRLMVRRCVESGVRQFGIAACLNREATGTKR